MPAMDIDAKQIMEFLASTAPLPKAGDVAAEYRAKMAAALAGREAEELPITRVETFKIKSEQGPVQVRLYADGIDTAPRATLIYMHGGGFVTCSIESHDHYCRRIAKETGLAVLSVDYRLAPEHPYPAGFDDCCAVLQWTASDAAAEYGIDASRIAVGGDSAGGAFAAGLCLWARDNGGPAITHQLLIYPVINNDFSTPSYSENANGFYLTMEGMQWFWRQYLGDESADVDEFGAPGRAKDLSNLPPATILTATFDPLRDEGADYARRLTDAGVPVEYRDYAAFHGFSGIETIKAARESRGFIAERLKKAMA